MKGKRESDTTLSNPMDCSLLDFSVHGIFQARVLEWGASAKSPRNCIQDPRRVHQRKIHLLGILLVKS